VTRYRHGLVLGKFYPPHLGHHHLIRAMAGRCERATVLVEAARAESIPLADRMAWLAAEHPDVTVLGSRCDLPVDYDDDQVWDAQVAVMKAALAGRPPVDVVFTSERYGARLAARLGAEHECVDPARSVFPVSGTAVRADLTGHWGDLSPTVRAGLAVRMVFVGAESTGTTTLSRRLAEHFRRRGGVFTDTRWVAEHGREYTELKWRTEDAPTLDDLVWTRDDFDAVAEEQTRRENEAAAAGSPLLVCDTDAFATSVWERRYLGTAARRGQRWALAPRPDMYLVTDHVGVPWQDDGLREGDLPLRAAMTEWFTSELTAAGHPWALLTGTEAQRLRLAIRIADQLLAWRTTFADPLTSSLERPVSVTDRPGPTGT
jgi:HTH-type transcriptional regulator, transcriptional repressor of NAD biosynthesis genes